MKTVLETAIPRELLANIPIGGQVFRYEFADERIFSSNYSDEQLEAMEEFPGVVACSCGGCNSNCVTTTKCSKC